jgi:hypothetical protein
MKTDTLPLPKSKRPISSNLDRSRQFELLITDVMKTHNLTRGQARRWFIEEIDKRKRESFHHTASPARNTSIKNQYRFVQNGTEIPTKSGSNRRVERNIRGGREGTTPRPGTKTEIILKAINKANGNREKIHTILAAHPRFADTTRSERSSDIATTAFRWGIPLTPARNATKSRYEQEETV